MRISPATKSQPYRVTAIHEERSYCAYNIHHLHSMIRMKLCRYSLQRLAFRRPIRVLPDSEIDRARQAAVGARHRSSVSAAELQFGQPLHETHPHLLKAGERKIAGLNILQRITAHEECLTVTPGVTAVEYAQRRSKLASKLPKNAIAIVVASDLKYRSGVVFYEFHQDSNFYYLTGIVGCPQKMGDAVEESQVSMNRKRLR